MLGARVALADPHGIAGPPEPETAEQKQAHRVQMASDMAAWLPRIVGRFRYEGMVDFNTEPADPGGAASDPPPDPLKMKSARGLGDCIRIGTGPGVQCVLNVTWPEEWDPHGQPVEGGDQFLKPALVLYGLDPNAAVLRYLQLDAGGLVQDGPAPLQGDTVSWTYTTTCVQSGNGVQPSCRRTTRIYAPAGGKTVQTSIEIDKWDQGNARWVKVAAYMLDMHRVPPVPAK